MFVRLFCTPDASELGTFTARLIDLILIDLAMPIRCLPIGGLEMSKLARVGWGEYQPLFGTNVSGPYVNVVSSNDPEAWSSLWTTNVTNLLVTTAVPPVMQPTHMLYGGAYQAVIVPTSPEGEIYRAWHSATELFKGMQSIVLPTPWHPEHPIAIRDVILG